MVRLPKVDKLLPPGHSQSQQGHTILPTREFNRLNF
jgi:hypothetical protein